MFLLEDHPAPIETPVLILYEGAWRIGAQRWDHPNFEDTYKSHLYWYCPYGSPDWDWEDGKITHWLPLPPIEKKPNEQL